MSELAVVKFTWITLYILKNSNSSQRSEILSILQKSNKNRLAEEEVASLGQSCKQSFQGHQWYLHVVYVDTFKYNVCK